jgi:predicted transcriptional regulator
VSKGKTLVFGPVAHRRAMLDAINKAAEKRANVDPTESRHGGNGNSRSAFASLKPSLKGLRGRVFRMIAKGRAKRLSTIANRLGKLPHQISGRLTELKRFGFVSVTHSTENSRGNLESVYSATRKGIEANV